MYSRKLGGKTFQGKILGHPQYIFITDPACVKYVLSDNFDNYEKVRGFALNFWILHAFFANRDNSSARA